jgi:sulfur transfer complex TusBCD TusB component (DsrH family)
MAKRILQIVETAYRATLEEQDDPVLWLAQSLRNGGADVHVLLKGNAVNYAVRGQDAAGLVFGDKPQTQPPRLDRDLGRLVEKGATVYLVEEDLAARGIQRGELLEGITQVSSTTLPTLFGTFEHVWHW